VHGLTYRRANRRLHVRGYKEEGTITTPFDMRVQNDIDRFHLVQDVVDNLEHWASKGAYLKQKMRDKLIEHKHLHRQARAGSAGNPELEMGQSHGGPAVGSVRDRNALNLIQGLRKRRSRCLDTGGILPLRLDRRDPGPAETTGGLNPTATGSDPRGGAKNAIPSPNLDPVVPRRAARPANASSGARYLPDGVQPANGPTFPLSLTPRGLDCAQPGRVTAV
jgi:hypothetical protein